MLLMTKYLHSASVSLTGQPLLSIPFENVPSINVFAGKHHRQKSVITAEWRYEAKYKALDEMGFVESYPMLKGRALCVVKFYPPHEEISDIHNVYVKPILDGFSDAGIWPDDEWAHLPLFWYQWAGFTEQIPRTPRRRTIIIDIYELGELLYNGVAQRLPKGRIRNG
jgi:hypothetical protein